MRAFPKPMVIVSKCLGFAHCRYNGQVISDEFVEKLRSHGTFRPVCPEVEIGLGVPRDPVRIVSAEGDLRLVQPTTGMDVTDRMRDFAHALLNSIEEVDGFILKGRSPSCGIKDVKVYTGPEKGASMSKGSGLFGGAAIDAFPHLPVEDEGRLRNFRIREHFLTQLFTLSRFRETKVSKSMRALVQFHSERKLLLMAYSQKELKLLGRIVANHDKKPVDEVLKEYEQHLFNAFSRTSKYTSNINVLMHALGYFSKDLSPQEKAFFLDALEKYREGRIPLSVCIHLLRSWAIRFEQGYLMQQTFLEPYPEELMEIADSGKGRNL